MAASIAADTTEALSMCLAMLQEECSDEKQYGDALNIILKIFRNVQRMPNDEKYRTIKKENKSFASSVWKWSSAQQLLLAAGWVEVDEMVFLPEVTHVDNALSTLQVALDRLPTRPDASSTASSQVKHQKQVPPRSKQAPNRVEKEHQLKQLDRQREERRRIAEQIEADRRETNSRQHRDIKARPRQFGANVKRFEDIGVDLNKGGG